jgi:hypothetical protein
MLRAAIRRSQELERLRDLPQPAPAEPAASPSEATPAADRPGESAQPAAPDLPAELPARDAAWEFPADAVAAAERNDPPAAAAAIVDGGAGTATQADAPREQPLMVAALPAADPPGEHVAVPLPPVRPAVAPASARPAAARPRQRRARAAAAAGQSAQPQPARDPLGELLSGAFSPPLREQPIAQPPRR